MRGALIDTDIFSEILKGKNDSVRRREAAFRADGGELTISAVTVMEIVKGLHRRAREADIAAFLGRLASIHVVGIDTEIASVAGRIYADLERAGRPIGRVDPLVAACAIVRDCDLVTGNVAHFEVVRSLGYRLEIANWRQA